MQNFILTMTWEVNIEEILDNFCESEEERKVILSKAEPSLFAEFEEYAQYYAQEGCPESVDIIYE